MAILSLGLSSAIQAAREIEAAAPKPAASAGKRTFGGPGTVPSSLLNSGNGGVGGFAAAKFSRLTADFYASQRSADQDLFGDNVRLRARARNLALDNPSARKFLAMVVQNVVGPAGILMQAKVKNENGKETAQTKRVNERIEEEWLAWCDVGSCSADGKYSFSELQQMAIKNAAREGENIAKFAYDRSFNSTGFAIQPIDNDQLDDTMMQRITDDVQVRLGVEVNGYLRPQAYYLWDSHPYDIVGPGGRRRRRIPASEIVHSFVAERPGQTRGYTWMAASILSMKMYDGYNEAELVAARATAAKFFSIESDVADSFDEDDEDESGSGTNFDGTQTMTANAGEGMVLDPGQHLNFIDPKHPTSQFKAFSQAAIRNIATGLLVSYPSLGNDLEGVNFSSIRAGLLDERDSWRIIQRWFIEHFCNPVFKAWLRMALLTTLSDIELSPRQMRQFAWKPRGWDWVDPLKDAQATVLKLQNGLITYTDALSTLGLDFEEVVTEHAREQELIEKLKLRMGTDIRGIADSADDAAGGTDGSGTAAAKGAAGASREAEAAIELADAVKRPDLTVQRTIRDNPPV